MAKIYQIGFLPAFLQGVYQGDISFKTIQGFSNIGLGTVNNLQGELLALDGAFYQFDAQADASLVASNVATPFAVVSQFLPSTFFELRDIASLSELNTTIEQQFPSKNLFYMLRIDGVFKNLHIRSEKCNFLPHTALSELLPKIQKKFYFDEIEGTLIASFFPTCCAPLAIPKFHYHFIDTERKKGGHVFDTEIMSANVAMQAYDELSLKGFNTPEFYSCDLELDVIDALKKIE